MERTFLHTFEPPADCPVNGATVDLTVADIESAGFREVLQTPGATYGTWNILDALLTQTGTGTPFIFKEPLGQAREVKVALSGLFGRFVARAYLERYLHLSIFAHLGSHNIDLDGQKEVTVRRLSRGDLPDWIACSSDLTSLTVAEAKGSHDPSGPDKALERAWMQAGRIDLMAQYRRVAVKRVAIATRWGVAETGLTEAFLSVRDPVDDSKAIDPAECDSVFIGILRLHIANLIRPLGHSRLAGALDQLIAQPSTEALRRDRDAAERLLDGSRIRKMENAVGGKGEVVGGIVTRGGPIIDSDVSQTDEMALKRLDLRPVFVGIERDLIQTAIDGDLEAARSYLKTVRSYSSTTEPSDGLTMADRTGSWIVPLPEEGASPSGERQPE